MKCRLLSEFIVVLWITRRVNLFYIIMPHTDNQEDMLKIRIYDLKFKQVKWVQPAAPLFLRYPKYDSKIDNLWKTFLEGLEGGNG